MNIKKNIYLFFFIICENRQNYYGRTKTFYQFIPLSISLAVPLMVYFTCVTILLLPGNTSFKETGNTCFRGVENGLGFSKIYIYIYIYIYTVL